MKRKDDVFRYMSHLLVTFGFTVGVLTVFAAFIGEHAKPYSNIFSLGDQGLSLETLAQFLMLSAIITGLRFCLFTDGLISRISLVFRTFLMFFIVILAISVFAVHYGWFPVNMLEAWGAFFACFAVCAIASSYIMAWKTDRENKEMEEALKRLKEEQEEKDEQEE